MKKFHNIKISLLLFILSLSGVSHSQVLRDPPGYTNPALFNTCFDQMGTIEFSSKQIFRGSDASSSKGSQVLTTYCIPLVGDLNGDGYPEIIGTGVSAGSYNSMKDVRIYNGQNGQLISTLALGETFGNNGVWHASPSYMALVNTKRAAIGLGTGESKNAELIVAFSNPGSTYGHRIESFDIIYNSNTKQYRLYSRWYAKYYDGSRSDRLAKPIPQVLDFDGDGKAEVLVYNRIFDAETGTIKLTLGNLTTSEGTCVHVGKDYNATHSATGDAYANFSYTYDMDFDGTYDYVAGGMIYYDIDFKGNHKLIDVSGTNYSYAGAPQNVKDGHTGVADINGDGIPDVVVVRSSSTDSKIEIVVWDPNLLVLNTSGIPVKNTGAIQPKLLARLEFSMNGSDFGNHSYVYIGDIDGREQTDRNTGKKYRLPEIAVLAGEFKYADSGSSTKTIARHPNLTENGLTIDTSPTQYSASSQSADRRNGDMIAVTWDVNATTPETRLKLSFAMEHKDRSANTGFTLFDFDNDGIQEICYKDEQTIRIIKGNTPQIKLGNNSATVFRQELQCTTGFEYPVIADVNNDASAEIIVVANGSDASYGQSYEGYIQAFGFGDKGFKFAPAWPVWNQFMYSPFKIKPDLTVPTPAERITNPLQYKYARKVVNNNSVDTLYSYQPFNGNIVQTAYFMDVPNANSSTDETFYEPIIFLTESFIVPETAPQEAHRPRIRVNGNTGYIELTISNKRTAKTDISINTPIAVYENIVSKETFIKKLSLDQLQVVDENRYVNSAIKAGDSIRVQIPINNPYSVYYVRLGDDSGYDQSTWKWSFGTNNGGAGTMGDIYSNPPEDPRDGYGIGLARRAYRDCDWRDQTIKAALIALNPDAATVQINGSAIIDIFANDEYPTNFPANSSNFVMSNSNIGSQPTAGSLAFSGKKVIYTNNGNIPEDGIDKFTYSFMYQPTGASAPVKFSANVYVYILQPETGGFAACYGTNLTTKLKETPEGVRFIWWNEAGTQVPTSDSLTINFGTLTVSKTFSVKPLLPFYNGDRLDFTPGNLTVDAIGANGKEATMKWTGAVSTDWNDYRNWLEIKDGNEVPVSFAPTSCVNVIIAKGAPNYPELTEDSYCNDIHLEDRAMIAGIHRLTYQNASMEFTLKQEEKDRFIMWSAPLKKVYTGDYHFKKGNTPYWGDVYMNFFQMVNPDYPQSIAKENAFTATFGSVGTELPLGTAFTAKVTNLNTDATFTFPQSATAYTDDKGNTATGLSRTNAGRFITDGAINTATGVLELPVNGNNSYKMIHVPNPFMAYLDINKFLQENSSTLESSYKLWDGDINSNYISVIASGEDEANRLIVDDSKIPASTVSFVPPLKSFFVMKKSASTNVQKLRITADMLTTSPATPPYTLRSTETEQNILRIRASQNGNENMTVLLNKERAVPAYKGDEDSYKLFNDASPIAVYTLSPAKDALAINSSGDFSSDVRLGVRLRQPGTVKLDFSGVNQFGHNVYLIDHALKDKLIALNATPTYTFTTETSPVNGQKVELNERFSLHFEANATGLEEIDDFGVKVYANNGRIYVESFNEPMSRLDVFKISGELIYASRKSSDSYKVRASANQVYLVKIKIGEKIKVIKVIGK
ncbi:hypothetical protein [Parabacteroides sp.]